MRARIFTQGFTVVCIGAGLFQSVAKKMTDSGEEVLLHEERLSADNIEKKFGSKFN